MKNLLVPTDFSAESTHALGVAMQLARHAGASVTLLHVLSAAEGGGGISTSGGPTGGGASLNDVFMLRLLQVTKRRLLEALAAAAAAANAPDVPTHDLVLVADTVPAILEAIETQHADLVVVGAQAHTTLDHLLYGSHTEALIRRAACPVLTVKSAVAAFAPQRILFPSDFQPEADRAVAGLRQVQALYPTAELHLLHVAKTEAEAAAAADRIRAFAERHGLAHTHPAVRVAASTPAGIGAHAQQLPADLLVVATHGRTGLSRLLHTGSVAEAVATHALPPVMTFRLG